MIWCLDIVVEYMECGSSSMFDFLKLEVSIKRSYGDFPKWNFNQ